MKVLSKSIENSSTYWPKRTVQSKHGVPIPYLNRKINPTSRRFHAYPLKIDWDIWCMSLSQINSLLWANHLKCTFLSLQFTSDSAVSWVTTERTDVFPCAKKKWAIKLQMCNALFTLDVCVCVNVTVKLTLTHSVKLTLTHRMGTFCAFAFVFVSPLMQC